MYLISAEGYKYARVNLLKVMNYELNPKNNKEVYAENDVMTTVIKRCRGGKKRGEIKIDGFTKKNWWFEDVKFQNAQNTKSNQK